MNFFFLGFKIFDKLSIIAQAVIFILCLVRSVSRLELIDNSYHNSFVVYFR